MSRIGISTCVAMGCLLLVTGAKSQTTESPGNSAGKDQPAVTNVPRLIQFSGVVKDGKGDPLGPADVRLTFSVYEQQQGGAALWTESQVVGLDDQGRYAVLLGVTQSRGVPLELFPAGKSRWLGLQVETREEEPRVLIVSVPYALKAEDAEKLGGKRASDFVLAEQLDEKLRTAVSVSVVPEAAAAPTGKAPAAAGGTPKSQSATNFVDGNATQVVSVQQNGTGDALTALTLSTTSGKAGVRGQATGATGQTFGVQGTTASNAGTGVSGLASATTGSTVGVRGQVNSANGIAGAFLTTNTGGKILSGRAGGAGTEKFSVDGAGNVRAYGYLDLLGNPFPGTGTVRSVASGTGLTGGPITSSGTLFLDTNFTDARYAAQTALNAETTARIAADAALQTGLGTRASLGPNSFTGDQSIAGNLSLTGPFSGATGSFTGTTVETAVFDVQQHGPGGTGNPTTALVATVSAAEGKTLAVSAISSSTLGRGVQGEASAATGETFGAVGLSYSSEGTGVQGQANSPSGQTRGVHGRVFSPDGTAGVFDNAGGGKILSGVTGGAEVFRMDANGVYANAYFDLVGNPIGGGTGTVTSVGSGSGLTGGPITSIGSLRLDTDFTDARYAAQTALNAEALARTDADLTLDAAKVSKAGDTMTGPLSVNGNLNLTGSLQGVTANFDSPPGTSTSALVVTQHTDGQDAKGLNASTFSTADMSAGVYGHAEGASGNTFGVSGEAVSPTGIGVAGQADSHTGSATGVRGVTWAERGTGVHGAAQESATQGVGVEAYAAAVTGSTMGVRGTVLSLDGIAGVFINNATPTPGKILSGVGNGAEVFRVDGSGNVRANAYLNLAGEPIGGGGTVTSVGSGPGLTGGPITSSGTLSLDTGFTDLRYAAQTALNAEALARTDADLTLDAAKVSKAGDTMTGPLTVPTLTGGTAVFSTNSPDGPGVSGTGPHVGVFGKSDLTSGYHWGVYGENNSPQGAGVWGQTSTPGGTGVSGYSGASTGRGVGVVGQTPSADGVGGIFANSGGGHILEGFAGAGEGRFVLDAAGNIWAYGTVRAQAGFEGDGSKLNNINASNANHAATADFATTAGSATTAENANNATAAQTAVTAAMATEAMNAATLGNIPAGSFAQLNASNTFAGPQVINGNVGDTLLAVTQGGTGPALSAQASGTDPWTAGIQGENTAVTGTTVGVAGTSRSADGRGVWAIAASPTGTTYGVYGQASSPDGVGTLGIGQSTTGANTGVWGESLSLDGVAGVFINRADGKLLSGRTSQGERFSVDGNGNIATIGNVTANGRLFGDGSGLVNVATSAGLTNEAAERQAADASQQTALATETGARETADALLQADISSRASLGTNTFGGDQNINGNLSLTGSINGGLVVRYDNMSPNVIGGSNANSITGGVRGGTIGGGGMPAHLGNLVTDDYGTIGGGLGNRAGDNAGTTNDRKYATVGGGETNTASGYRATVGGGLNNTASGSESSVGGGDGNAASESDTTVAGGYHNIASGIESTVGGGVENTASGTAATVPGGSSNVAQGMGSFAAGLNAHANHMGSFVWADWGGLEFDSGGDNQFAARATGGVAFYTSVDLSSGVSLAPGGGAWATMSDRNVKANIAPVDGKVLLARIAELPLSTWNYRSQSPSIRHIGPMAQDFKAAFSLGEDDKHISTVDADGVALAAIQALYQLTMERDQKIGQLSRELDALRAEIAQLKQALK